MQHLNSHLRSAAARFVSSRALIAVPKFARRASSAAITVRFSVAEKSIHPLISSSVRKHPPHMPVTGSMMHTLVQGEVTDAEPAS